MAVGMEFGKRMEGDHLTTNVTFDEFPVPFKVYKKMLVAKAPLYEELTHVKITNLANSAVNYQLITNSKSLVSVWATGQRSSGLKIRLEAFCREESEETGKTMEVKMIE